MSASSILRVNRSKVVSELFDDEVVIIDMVSGNYFSLDTVGAEIWTLIQNDATAEGIVRKLTQIYEGDPSIIDTSVRQFLERIQAEQLVIAVDGEACESNPPGLAGEEHAPSSERKVFRPPTLSKFTDMQELLLLDPIHDVDETGWPAPAPDRPKP